jgi:hypothetical protein
VCTNKHGGEGVVGGERILWCSPRTPKANLPFLPRFTLDFGKERS